jgi:hypothetical protein
MCFTISSFSTEECPGTEASGCGSGDANDDVCDEDDVADVGIISLQDKKKTRRTKKGKTTM